MAIYTRNLGNLGKVTKPLHELSLVKKFKVLSARCPPLVIELQAKVRGARYPLQTREKTTPFWTWVTDSSQMSPVISLGSS